MPAGLKAVLVDPANLRHIDLKKQFRYAFLPDQRTLRKEFDLIVGSDAFFASERVLNNMIPDTYSLSQNFPNPFNAGTSIKYEIPTGSHVSVNVMNLLGQEVKELISGHHSPGNYLVRWDGTDHLGRELASGIYYIRLKAIDFIQIRKVVLLR